MSVDQYLRQIRKYTPLTREEEKALFKKAKSGDQKAYNDIITSNLRFVVSVAKKYQEQGLPLEELISEGNYGLIKAYHKFDYNKGFKFITYAVWWIRQAILNSIHENAKTIRLPLNKITNVTKIAKLKDQLEQEMARSLSINELAEYIDEPEILYDLQYNYTTIDLHQPQTENDQDLTNIIASEEPLEDSLDIMRDELEDILKDFSDREQEIIRMYYGIGYLRPYTLKEIGIDMGLTRERIRQIKEKILEKLRKKQNSDRLRSYIK